MNARNIKKHFNRDKKLILSIPTIMFEGDIPKMNWEDRVKDIYPGLTFSSDGEFLYNGRVCIVNLYRTYSGVDPRIGNPGEDYILLERTNLLWSWYDKSLCDFYFLDSNDSLHMPEEIYSLHNEESKWIDKYLFGFTYTGIQKKYLKDPFILLSNIGNWERFTYKFTEDAFYIELYQYNNNSIPYTNDLCSYIAKFCEVDGIKILSSRFNINNL